MNQNPFQIRKYAQTKKNKTKKRGTMMDVEKVVRLVFLRKSYFFQEDPMFP